MFGLLLLLTCFCTAEAEYGCDEVRADIILSIDDNCGLYAGVYGEMPWNCENALPTSYCVKNMGYYNINFTHYGNECPKGYTKTRSDTIRCNDMKYYDMCHGCLSTLEKACDKRMYPVWMAKIFPCNSFFGGKEAEDQRCSKDKKYTACHTRVPGEHRNILAYHINGDWCPKGYWADLTLNCDESKNKDLHVCDLCLLYVEGK